MLYRTTGLGADEDRARLDPKDYLPMARTLLGYIAANMEAGLGYSADQSIKGADIQINPAQKLYDVELRHTSLLLWDEYPHMTSGAWLTRLRNNMGYRIVESIFCAANMKVDPITRVCVPLNAEPGPVQPPVIPPVIPPPIHIPPDQASTLGLDKKWLYLGGALALVLLLRK